MCMLLLNQLSYHQLILFFICMCFKVNTRREALTEIIRVVKTIHKYWPFKTTALPLNVQKYFIKIIYWVNLLNNLFYTEHKLTYIVLDVNECNTTSSCGVHANCTNYNGSYSCECPFSKPQGDPYMHCYGKSAIITVLVLTSSWCNLIIEDHECFTSLNVLGCTTFSFSSNTFHVFKKLKWQSILNENRCIEHFTNRRTSSIHKTMSSGQN